MSNPNEEITLAEARERFGAGIVKATLVHLKTPEWPEGTTIAAQFFERMDQAVAAFLEETRSAMPGSGGGS